MGFPSWYSQGQIATLICVHQEEDRPEILIYNLQRGLLSIREAQIPSC